MLLLHRNVNLSYINVNISNFALREKKTNYVIKLSKILPSRKYVIKNVTFNRQAIPVFKTLNS